MKKPGAVARLRALIDQAEAGSLEGHMMAAAALQIGIESLQAKRSYTNRDGDALSYDAPEHQNGLRALEVAAHLAKLTQPGSSEAPNSPGLTEGDLRKAGIRLVVNQ